MEDTQGLSAPIIEIKGVQHRYSGAAKLAVNEIDLNIPSGCCFGLLGPNGAGKTTLISLLTGALPLQHGSIQVDGLKLPQQGKLLKRISSLVPQEYAFYPSLTARENLRFFAGLYNIPKPEREERIDYSVQVCNLTQVLDQAASQFSGGLKRRLNLAIGLLSKPKVIYLDEPTVGIDAQSRQLILQAIEHLKGSGITIIYTSHYMEEVERICDEIAIIDQGRVLLKNKLTNLLTASKKIKITPKNQPEQTDLLSLSRNAGINWDNNSFIVSPSHQQSLSNILGLLEANQISIKHMHMDSSRLEDIYLNTISHDVES